jgi:hypothetical protein
MLLDSAQGTAKPKGVIAFDVLCSKAVLENDAAHLLLAPWLSGRGFGVFHADLNAEADDPYQLYLDDLQSLGVQG